MALRLRLLNSRRRSCRLPRCRPPPPPPPLRPRQLLRRLQPRRRLPLQPPLRLLRRPPSNLMVTEWEKPYTVGEEVANSVIHVVGSHLGAAMIALLVWQAVHSGVDLGWKITSGCIFGATVILLYAISGAYHAVTYRPAKDVLKILDHMAIYFLIAGTYTPFCLVTLRRSGTRASAAMSRRRPMS